ncbi:MAG: DotU family type IV/VI secretion system protein [Acidobacteriota bacterium]
MRLADCFIEAVTYVLDVARKPQSFPQFDVVRAKVEELLNSSGRMAKTLGVAASEFQDARFAVCAWMDEMILGSQWEGKALWLHQPLQRTVYNTVNAGDEYFDRLDNLLAKTAQDFSFSPSPVSSGKATVEELSFGPDAAGESVEDSADAAGGPGTGCKLPPTASAPFKALAEDTDTGLGVRGVLEVYGLTLMLGFQGKYFHPDDQAALHSLRKKVVTTALGATAHYGRDPAARLFPGLYPAQAPAKPRRRFWRGLDWVDMVVIGLPILGVAVMFYAYSFILSGALKGFLGGP